MRFPSSQMEQLLREKAQMANEIASLMRENRALADRCDLLEARDEAKDGSHPLQLRVAPGLLAPILKCLVGEGR